LLLTAIDLGCELQKIRLFWKGVKGKGRVPFSALPSCLLVSVSGQPERKAHLSHTLVPADLCLLLYLTVTLRYLVLFPEDQDTLMHLRALAMERRADAEPATAGAVAWDLACSLIHTPGNRYKP